MKTVGVPGDPNLDAAPTEIRQAISEHLTGLLGDDRLTETMAGFLPGDAASQARLPELREKLRRLARSD